MVLLLVLFEWYFVYCYTLMASVYKVTVCTIHEWYSFKNSKTLFTSFPVPRLSFGKLVRFASNNSFVSNCIATSKNSTKATENNWLLSIIGGGGVVGEIACVIRVRGFQERASVLLPWPTSGGSDISWSTIRVIIYSPILTITQFHRKQSLLFIVSLKRARDPRYSLCWLVWRSLAPARYVNPPLM